MGCGPDDVEDAQATSRNAAERINDTRTDTLPASLRQLTTTLPILRERHDAGRAAQTPRERLCDRAVELETCFGIRGQRSGDRSRANDERIDALERRRGHRGVL